MSTTPVKRPQIPTKLLFQAGGFLVKTISKSPVGAKVMKIGKQIQSHPVAGVVATVATTIASSQEAKAELKKMLQLAVKKVTGTEYSEEKIDSILAEYKEELLAGIAVNDVQAFLSEVVERHFQNQ